MAAIVLRCGSALKASEVMMALYAGRWPVRDHSKSLSAKNFRNLPIAAVCSGVRSFCETAQVWPSAYCAWAPPKELRIGVDGIAALVERRALGFGLGVVVADNPGAVELHATVAGKESVDRAAVVEVLGGVILVEDRLVHLDDLLGFRRVQFHMLRVGEEVGILLEEIGVEIAGVECCLVGQVLDEVGLAGLLLELLRPGRAVRPATSAGSACRRH